MKMLVYTLIEVILLNFKRLQKHKNSSPRKHPSWTQVYNLSTPKGMNWTIRNLDLKYFTNEDVILHTHWSDPFEL